MTWLPIVQRELRVGSRRWRTYWSRVGSGVAAAAICFWISLTFRAANNNPAIIGSTLFATLGFVFLIYCLFSGVRATADCISREKREGTLGLLFLTDLKGYDVVLGKLAAGALVPGYALLAAMPILGIPLLLGGTTASVFWLAMLVLLNSLFFSLATGVLVSSVTRQDRQASSGTLFLILMIAIGLPGLGWAWDAWSGQTALWPWLRISSPGYAFFMVANSRIGFSAVEFWSSVGVIHFLAWLWLGLASWITPRVWQEKGGRTRPKSWRQRWQYWTLGTPERRAARRKRLLRVNPIYWLGSRNRLKPVYLWGFLVVIIGLWTGAAIQWKSEVFTFGACIATAYVLHGGLKLWMGSESARLLGHEQRVASMEILLSTPLTERSILSGQWLALRRQFTGPVIGVMVLDGLLFGLGWIHSSGEQKEMLLWLFVVGTVVLFTDLIALGWVGMWQGMKARRLQLAASNTIAYVLVYPWIVFYLSMVAFALSGWGDPTFLKVLMYWFGLGLAFDVAFSWWAWRTLLLHLRTMAAHQHSGTAYHPIWRALGRLYARWRHSPAITSRPAS